MGRAIRAYLRAAKPALSSIVTCCVTGAIPGDGGACGDCDPCLFSEASLPSPVKRLIAEKNSLLHRIGELEDKLAETLTAPGATTKSDDGFLGTLPSGESEPVVTPTYLSSDTYTIAHDDFTGTVQGRYVTREGKEGVVLQQVGTRVVHVYGRKWIDGSATSDPSSTRSDELDDRERDYALYGLREEDLP